MQKIASLVFFTLPQNTNKTVQITTTLLLYKDSKTRSGYHALLAVIKNKTRTYWQKNNRKKIRLSMLEACF